MGLFAIGQGLVISLALVSHLGMNSAIVRVASLNPSSVPVLRLLYRSLGVALSVSAIVAISIGLLSSLFPNTNSLFETVYEARYFLVAVPALTLSYVLSGFFKAARLPATAIVIEPGYVALLGALLIEFTFRVSPEKIGDNSSVAISYVIAAWVVFLGAIARFLAWRIRPSYQSRQPLTNLDIMGLIDFLKMSVSFLVISISEIVQNGVMVIVAGMVLLDEELGLFRTAERLTILICFLLIVINAVLPPQIVEAYAKRNMAGLELIVRRYAAMSMVFGVSVSLPLIFFPSDVLAIFGEEFESANRVLQVLVVGQLSISITGSSIMILKMTDHLGLARNISVVSNIIFIVTFAFLVNMYKVMGAGIAVSAWLFFQHLIATIFVHRKLGIMVIPFLPRSVHSITLEGCDRKLN